MSRRLRFIPEGGALVEVTCRSIQGRFLLKPSPVLNEIVVGVLGRAQELYPVDLCGLIFTSNHYHLLLRVQDAQCLSRFMNHVNSNIAREAGKLAQCGRSSGRGGISTSWSARRRRPRSAG